MKKTAVFLKVAGLLMLAVGFFIPWYVWGVEFVGNKVAVSVFNLHLCKQVIGDPFEEGINKISVWQLLSPRSLVKEKPLIRGAYTEITGITPNDALEDIGVKWAIVPALTLLLFTVTLVSSVVRMQGISSLKESLIPLLVGACILLLLFLWDPMVPAALKGCKPTPSLGKYVTMFAALLLTTSGFINLLAGRSAKQSTAS